MPPRILPSRNAKTAAFANVVAVLEAESQSEHEPEADDIVQVKVKAKAENAVHNVVEEESEQTIAAQKKPRSLFTNFTSSKELPQGLSVVRRLGRHKFEIINLEAVGLTELGTEEMGRRISGSTSLKAAFDIPQDIWDDARAKVEQALNSATGGIFRFLKLPIELRFRCYEFLVLSSRTLSTNLFCPEPMSFTSGLSARLLNKQIAEESTPFFWKNNFAVPSICKVLKSFLPTFMENVREITFQWTGHRNLDRLTFEMFASCRNLKTLNILVRHCLCYEDDTQTRQHLHLHEKTIKKFSKLTGFDALASIRGLNRVNVSPTPDFDSQGANNRGRPSRAQIEDLRVWLQHQLTQPKIAFEQITTKPKRKISKNRGKQAKKDDADFRP